MGTSEHAATLQDGSPAEVADGQWTAAGLPSCNGSIVLGGAGLAGCLLSLHLYPPAKQHPGSNCYLAYGRLLLQQLPLLTDMKLLEPPAPPQHNNAVQLAVAH